MDWSGAFPAFAPSRRAARRAGRVARLLAIRSEVEATRAVMQARCDRGADVASLPGFGAPIAESMRALDQHRDGMGQPRGLRGEEIPLLGRILCLSERPHRAAMPSEQALAIIRVEARCHLEQAAATAPAELAGDPDAPAEAASEAHAEEAHAEEARVESMLDRGEPLAGDER